MPGSQISKRCVVTRSYAWSAPSSIAPFSDRSTPVRSSESSSTVAVCGLPSFEITARTFHRCPSCRTTSPSWTSRPCSDIPSFRQGIG